MAAPSAEVKESAEQTPNLDEEKTKTESQPTEDKKNAEQTATDHPEEKPREKTEEEKKQEFLERQTAIIVDSIREFVGGKRIMKLIGLDLGKNRTPFQNMTDEEEAAMKAELEAINFFERCNK